MVSIQRNCGFFLRVQGGSERETVSHIRLGLSSGPRSPRGKHVGRKPAVTVAVTVQMSVTRNSLTCRAVQSVHVPYWISRNSSPHHATRQPVTIVSTRFTDSHTLPVIKVTAAWEFSLTSGRLSSLIFCSRLFLCFSPTRPAGLFYSFSSF